jgi:tetratricopeptide (TPR) repeat protein
MGYVSLGQALYKAKRFAEAVKTYEHGLRLDALNTPLIYDLGLAYIATGDRQNAANMLEMLRALHSEEYAAKLAKALGE